MDPDQLNVYNFRLKTFERIQIGQHLKRADLAFAAIGGIAPADRTGLDLTTLGHGDRLAVPTFPFSDGPARALPFRSHG